MATKRKYSFYITDEQLEGLRKIKARDGILESEQIRRAIDAWLDSKGATMEQKRKPSEPRMK